MNNKRKQGLIVRFFDFFTQDIWLQDLEQGRLGKNIRGLSRWIYLVFKGFFEDQCIIRASALTFTTVLSIVPFLAVAFSISKGMGLQNKDFIRDLLMRVSAGREQVVENILGYISNTNVKTLGLVGVVTLLVTVYTMISTIEKAFNSIWHVAKGRSPWRKFTDFFSVILVCPLLILLATSFTVTVQQHELVQTLLSVSAIGYIEAVLLKLAPLILLWLGFTFIYSFIPNAKVRFSSAALGGAVASILWQLAQWVYISWQIGAKNYNAIYGSFAQLPLFLMWLYISWVIVLLGAEVSFAFQHLKSFTKQRFMRRAGLRQRQKMAMLMLLEMTQRFVNGEPQASVSEISDGLMIPEELVIEIMNGLEEEGLVLQSEEEDGQYYTPAVDPRMITVTRVLRAVAGLDRGLDGPSLDGRFLFVDRLFTDLDRAGEESPANRSLADYAQEYGRRSVIFEEVQPEPEAN